MSGSVASVSERSPEAVEHDDALSLLDLVGVLVRRRRLIASVTVAGTLLVFGYALLSLVLPSTSRWNLLPDIYRPDAKVLLAEEDSSGLASLGLGTEGSGALGQLLGVCQRQQQRGAGAGTAGGAHHS